MDFKELQNKVVKNAIDYGKKYNVRIDADFALLKLYEEVGELAQAVLIHRKKSRPEKHLPKKISKKQVAKELADVVGMAIVNAHLLGIDLEEAIDKKWINKEWINNKKTKNL
ncbi:MAG: MazG nucleotide pyrophosphohydrolase domain-containing protein [Patescibacteria group bacterium]|nr:MazG nucleotide pyrophosphohydrolase domain-containing protein [Patescibacteria group bacterium]